MCKPISISLSPNTERDDIRISLRLIFQPWIWKKRYVRQKDENRPIDPLFYLEEEFRKYLKVKYAVSFNSGRSALIAILKSLELKKGDEVLLQVPTCNAAVNPIIWSGLDPVFVDCNKETFNIDTNDLKRKITTRSKVVIVQHTFGLPADLDKISEICQENNLILIEDCAHSLGAHFQEKKVGTFGRASFFSFGRDKVISSVYGGMVATNDDGLAEKVREFQKEIGYPSYFWIFQQLLHPFLMNCLILPTYSVFGKYILILFQWLKVLSKAVHWKEKRGLMPNYFPKRLPPALAILAINQFNKLERFNNHRKEIAKFYFEKLKDTFLELPVTSNDREHIFLRFTVKSPKAWKIIKKAWRNNILIGDWYNALISPNDTVLDKMKYRKGSCPQAEELIERLFNLPTHINISKKEAQKIVDFLKTTL